MLSKQNSPLLKFRLFFFQQLGLLLLGAVALPDEQSQPLGPGIVEHLLQAGIDPAADLLAIGKLGQLCFVIQRNIVLLIHQNQVPPIFFPRCRMEQPVQQQPAAAIPPKIPPAKQGRYQHQRCHFAQKFHLIHPFLPNNSIPFSNLPLIQRKRQKLLV